MRSPFGQRQRRRYVPFALLLLSLLLLGLILAWLGLLPRWSGEGAAQIAGTAPAGSQTVAESAALPTLGGEATPTRAVAALPATLTPWPTSSPSPVTPLPSPSPTAPLAEVWQPLQPLPSAWRGLITHGGRDRQQVALTFDVGQRPDLPAGFDHEIVRVLTEAQAPATFFLGGDWMRTHETEARLLAAEPLFELGNHGWAHLDFQEIDRAAMDREILQVQQLFWEMFGWQPVLFRFPYGTYTEEALAVVADHGMLSIQWDVVSGDPDPNVTAEAMAPWVLQQVQPGSIIIMHANGRGWHTAEALPTIIASLREQGYELVTISALLDLENVSPATNR